MKRSALSIGLLVAWLVGPASAEAGTVIAEGSGSDRTVVFTAAAGESNEVTAAFGSGGVRISDTTAPITAGAGCNAVAPGSVECPAADVVRIILGDGDDRVFSVLTDSSAPRRVELLGGAGEDSLFGSFERDLIAGGPGADDISAGGGRDIVQEGDDPGAHDSIDGGPERDELSYAGTRTPVRVDLLAGTGGRGGTDDTISGIEDLTGSDARDVLLGDHGRNRIVGMQLEGGSPRPRGDRIAGRGGDDDLDGAGGGDRIEGGPGDDSLGSGGGLNVLLGGPGDDLFQLGSTGQTRLRCGSGDDFFSALGGLFIVARTCERFTSAHGTIRLRARGPRLVLTFPNRSCRVLLRVGRTGTPKRVGSARGSRVAFNLPKRRTGAVTLWARSGCDERPTFTKLVRLLLG